MEFLSFIEIIGTVAFAISGALVGMNKRLDLFGVTFLAVVTATGGGILRDVFIGNIPPSSFKNPMYFMISIVVAFIVFYVYPKTMDCICDHKRAYRILGTSRVLILVSDAMGLGVFTAVGANAAMANFGDNIFIVISMAMLTGVGGGMIRDVLIRNIPLVLTREIYAVATIIGAVVFYLLSFVTTNLIAMYSSFLITVIIRMIAIKYNLNLPQAKNNIRQC